MATVDCSKTAADARHRALFSYVVPRPRLRTVAMLMVFMTIVGGVYSLQDKIAQSVNAH